MIKLLTSLLLLPLLFSCSNNDSSADKANKDTAASATYSKPNEETFGDYKADGDSLIIPSFEIEVSLSPKAEKKLAAQKETLIVSASFSGIPKDTASEAYLQSGEMGIVNHEIELKNSRLATFENIKFPKSLYDSLADKDIQVLINVFTGRKSSGDNLVNCEILQDKMSNVKGKTFTLKARLIYGDE